MIRKIQIRNYRSLKDVRLKTGPINVLIGENGAGKSSVLDAIRMLSDLVSMPWTAAFKPRRRSPFPDLVRRGSTERTVSLDVEFGTATGKYRYSIVLLQNGDSPVPGAKEEIMTDLSNGRDLMRLSQGKGTAWDAQAGATAPVQLVPDMSGLVGLADIAKFPWAVDARTFWNSVRLFRFDPDAIRKPAKVDPSAEIEEDGSGLPAVFDNLETEIQEAVNSSMASAGPDIVRFESRAAYDGNKILALRETWDKKPFLPSQISDGTLRHLALVVLGYIGASAPVVLVEEPENGLNPHRYVGLIELWRGAAEANGPQFIMATHSTSFLDYVREGELFHASKTKGISRIAKVSDVPRFRERMEAFDGPLGEAWFSGVLDAGEEP
jgi:predicted ATPase